MKTKLLLLLSLLLMLSIQAQHTFSIVAVDPTTGEIGSAGATCISAEDGALAISDIILGIGAIHTQAAWHPTNQTNARTRLQAGDSPQEVIDWLIANDAGGSAASRQYNIVDLNAGNPRSAAHTGANCYTENIHLTGTNYAIAGNILISEDVVNDMETAFLNTTGSLADKLMAAMQGGKRVGSDARCESYGISSASAFLRVAAPTDTDSSYGNLSLDLNVWITTDLFEPIDALQDLYDATTTGVIDVEEDSKSIHIIPNPATATFLIQSKGIMMNGFEIRDIHGKLLDKHKNIILQNNIFVDSSPYSKGVYLIGIFKNDKKIATKKLIITD